MKKWRTTTILSLSVIGVYYLILFFPTSEPRNFSSIFVYRPYSCWWVVRMTALLFGASFLPAKSSGSRFFTGCVATVFCFPFSLGTACLQIMPFKSFAWMEAWAWLVFGEILWLTSGENFDKVRNAYFPAIFFVSVTPVYLYFLYREMWHYNVMWLLSISPYGIVCMPPKWGHMYFPSLIIAADFCLRRQGR